MTEFGNPLEAFVIGALRKHAAWLDEPGTVGHWRTHDGDEVDRVMESDDGRVPAFEVKATERVTTRDLPRSRRPRGSIRRRSRTHVGACASSHDDQIHLMPVDRLWRPVP